MHRSYRLSPRARADLEDIFLYSAGRWSVRQADSYVLEIEGATATVAAAPELGRSLEDVRSGYFKYAVRSHLVIYRCVPSGIDVIRVLHQRMDIRRHL